MSLSSPLVRSSTSIPIFSDTVNQNFFIESLGGSQQPTSYLSRFPETIYNTALDSVLVTFLYALMGPAGAGALREQALEARLEVEQQNVVHASLDQLYSAPFNFARLAQETYDIDASADLLTTAEREQILQSDAAFRNRALDYLKAIRAGGTVQGITLAAKSGLGYPVEIIENYRALFDQHSDSPLGIPYMGTTTKLSEIIVVPRNDLPQNSQQTITLTSANTSYDGQPTQGWFTLSVPLGPNYQVAQVGITSGSNVITVPNASLCVPGTYITLAPTLTASPTIYAQVASVLTPTSIAVVYPPTSASAGQPFNMPATSTYTAYIGNAQTIPLPFNVSATTIENALEALPVVGSNVQVTGGPLPDLPVTITFVGDLGNRTIPIILVNTAPDAIAGIGSPGALSPLVGQLADITGNPLYIAATVTQGSNNAPARKDDTISVIDQYNMQQAVDQLKPMTSFVSTNRAHTTTAPVVANHTFSENQFTGVVTFETGNPANNWPNGWIKSGKEVEKPKPPKHKNQHHAKHHAVHAAVAYTEAALNDPHYESQAGDTPLWVTYWNTHIGRFSKAQCALFPFLSKYTDTKTHFSPIQALAPEPRLHLVRCGVSTNMIIDDSYPSGYLVLPGVPPIKTKPGFWSSTERAPTLTPITDYLELDLGEVHAVNHLYFEATDKPCAITLDYDIRGQAPQRRFVPAHLVAHYEAPSVASLTYRSHSHHWETVNMHFCNARGSMIFTRYIRIGFQHEPGKSPFEDAKTGQEIPYSIEVRNLRIGRLLTPHRKPRPRIHH